MNKRQLIKFIKKLPNDIDVFIAIDNKNCYDIIDIKIFTEPKDKKYYEMYFGM